MSARANQARLIVAQLLGGVGIASGVAVGGLLAERVAGNTQSAGFAQTAAVIGAGVLAIPLARLAARRGRRASLTLGFGLGAVGAVVVLAAVIGQQFWLLLAGMMLFGSGTATNLQSRYAATELVEPRHQARAMSIVLWATTVGSVAGPNLSEPGNNLGSAIGLEPFAGPYLFSVVAFLLAALVVATLRMGLPPGSRPRRARGASVTAGVDATAVVADAGAVSGADAGAEHPKPVTVLAALRIAARDRHALFALVAIVAGQMMMVSVMVMTPVSMSHDGMSLELVGLVISVHILGMYAASPLFGALSDRIGPKAVVLLGALLFVTAFTLGAMDATAPHSDMGRIMVSLGLLGLGWSASIIGGSTLLTQSVSPSARVPLQGAVDAMMNLGAAALAAVAGPVLAWGGFLAVNVMAACILAPLIVLGVRSLAAGVRPGGQRDAVSASTSGDGVEGD
ncbi:MFS transporter [Leifsonia sp. Root112D2]|uniref:MFS transporter n=1 Tax=Leifsonia sp. Root112D2 TaxID=1736426 RepID=UPI0009EB2510|nr:MFS transporter [Leifsonia sp. Root112D2]